MSISEETLKQIECALTPLIDLSGQGYDDDDAIKIADALQKNPNVTQLNLRDNGIGDHGVEALSKIKTLTELDLSNGMSGYNDYFNNVTYIGIQYLTRSSLKKLNLAGNTGVGDKGAEFLAANQSLIDLNLANCGLTSVGGKIMLSAINNIETLSMEANSIGNEGLQTKINGTLKNLYLMFCGISLEGVKALADNKTLLFVNLYGNPLDEAACDFLQSIYEDSFGQTFTRTSEFIEQLLKKSIDVASHGVGSVVTSPPSPPVISNPLASNPVIFTPSHKRALSASSTQTQERIEDSPPRKAAALIAIPQCQDFVLAATAEEMQELYRAFQEAYELAHRQQTSLSGPPLSLSSK